MMVMVMPMAIMMRSAMLMIKKAMLVMMARLGAYICDSCFGRNA